MILSLIANALKAAAIPNIDGVSVGIPDTDRSKWEVQFLPAATPAHKAAAAAVLAGVAIDAPAQDALLQIQFGATSRQKDILATIALIKRAQGIPAWNALTTPQKVAAVLAEADVWTTIRDFIEKNT